MATVQITQLAGQTGGTQGILLPISIQPKYAFRPDYGASINLAANGVAGQMVGSPAYTAGTTQAPPIYTLGGGSTGSYLNTGILPTGNFSFVTVVKMATITNGVSLVSNFANGPTGNLWFANLTSGMYFTYSTSSTALTNVQCQITQYAAGNTAYGLYFGSLTTSADGTVSTIHLENATTGYSNSLSGGAAFISPSVLPLWLGANPSSFWTDTYSQSDFYYFDSVLSSEDKAVLLTRVRVRMARFGITV